MTKKSGGSSAVVDDVDLRLRRRCEAIRSHPGDLDDVVMAAARWDAFSIAGDPYGNAMSQLLDAYRARVAALVPVIDLRHELTFYDMLDMRNSHSLPERSEVCLCDAERSVDQALQILSRLQSSAKYTGSRKLDPVYFEFSTKVLACPISDGMGGKLEVVGRRISTSGRFYLRGSVHRVCDMDPTLARRYAMDHGRLYVELRMAEFHMLDSFTEEDVMLDSAGRVVLTGRDDAAPAP